jgi:hypothetical protein
MKRTLIIATTCLALFGCKKATPKGTLFGKVDDRIVHLPSGDSIEWQLTLPASVKGSPPGILVEFYPFQSIGDTVALRSTALALFPIAIRELSSGSPNFLVLRAVSLRARDRKGFYHIHNYGFVFDHRSDGHWYRLNDSIPLR